MAQLSPNQQLPPNVWATAPEMDDPGMPDVTQMPKLPSRSVFADAGPEPTPLNLPVPHGGVPQVFAAPPEMPAVSQESPVSGQLRETDARLRKFQHEDADPYGSPDNHPGIGGKILHGLSMLGNIAGDALVPNEMSIIPGTQRYRQDQEQTLTGRLQGLEKQQSEEADQQSQASERDALGRKASALADADTPQPLSAEDAQAIGHPELEGIMLAPRDRAKYFGNVLGADTKVKTTGMNNDTKVTTTGMVDDTRDKDNQRNNGTKEAISDAANKTRVLVAGMHDATSRANNENTVSHKGSAGTGDGSFKVPADVTKRAALAANVNENADAVDALVKQHPDIIGATGGRYSSVQQMIGSDDPAIAELGVRIHNIALASNGAHGVRAQGAIAETENNLFNHFKSGPNAIHGALEATRGSMKTFLDDETNFSSSGKRGGNGQGKPGGAAQLPQAGAVEDGYRFKGGDPKDQKNWEKVK